jgi:3-hydroxybutyryl-CoA dehydrogenase
MLEIRKVGVVGCGLMGSGIAEVAARAGFETVVVEVSDDFLQKGLGRIRGSLKGAAEKKKVDPAEADAALARIRGSTKREDLAGCDIVIEAIIESMDAKKELFAALDKILAPGAIIASNTSSLSVTEMAAATKRPDRVLGLHFFNPVPVMKLLEIVRAFQTSDETLAIARAFGEKLGKATIVAKDTPGFIVNMLLVPYLLGAIRMYEAGLATKEDIDTGVKLGLSHPMGPLTLLDYVGLDTTLYIADVLFDELKGAEYSAPPLLRRMVAAGYHGRKTGRGFYDWSSGQPK